MAIELAAADVAGVRDVLEGRSSNYVAPEAAATTTDTTPATTQAEPATDVSRGTDAAPAATTQAAPAAVTPPAFNLEALGFKSSEELIAAIRERDALKTENQQLAEYKSGPKFKDDRAKLFYEFANEVPGMEPERARQMIEIIGLDLTNAPAQRVRFEAFKLDPSLQGLSTEEIRDLFEDEENKRFGSPTEDEDPRLAKLRIVKEKQATEAAKRVLQDVQQKWHAASPVVKSPQEIAQEKYEYQQLVVESLANFKGIDGIKVTALNAGKEKVDSSFNFPLDDARKKVVQEAINDLPGWWDAKMESLGIYTPEGTHPDIGKLADFITFMENRDAMLSEAFQHGLAAGETQRIKDAKKLTDPSQGVTSPVSDAPVNEQKEKVSGALSALGFRKIV